MTLAIGYIAWLDQTLLMKVSTIDVAVKPIYWPLFVYPPPTPIQKEVNIMVYIVGSTKN